MIRRPPGSTRTDTLFPYTTLFRSCRLAGEVAAAGLRCFDTPAATLAREWDPVRAYFEVLEAFDARYPGRNLKIGSNLAETHNRETRAVWRYARHSDIRLIEQRLLTRQGYIKIGRASCSESVCQNV